MIETIAVQKILNDELARRKSGNPAYSLRSFARSLGVSPAGLSLLLNGRRPASKKFAQGLATRLGLDPTQTSELLGLYDLKKARPRFEEKLRLQTDQFHLIADWHYFAILSLFETKGAKADPKWVAGRLGIPVAKAATSLERLERLGYIQRGRGFAVKLTNQAVTTSDEIASAAIRKNHAQTLDRAKVSLEQDPLELRDFLSITLAIDPAKIPQAKVLMREFREKLGQFLESGAKKEVYSLALQLIPLSKPEVRP